MKLFVKMVNSLQPVSIFAEFAIRDGCQGPAYAPGYSI